MKQPKKTPFLKYYSGSIYYGLRYLGSVSVEIFLFIVDGIRQKVHNIYNAIGGRWYCEYCHKYHGRRVLHYKLARWKYTFQICSLGVHAVRVEKWLPMLFADEDIRRITLDNESLARYFAVHKEDDDCEH